MSELLKVVDLKKYFPVRGGLFRRVVANVKAVDGVSFELEKGRTLGLVGAGNIGLEFVKLVVPFGMRVIGFDPAYDDAGARRDGFELCSLEDVFRTAEELGIDLSRPERGSDEEDARRAARPF